MSIFTLGAQGRAPLYGQIYVKIVELISSGELKPNEQLPSVRQLAHDLGINPNTVSRAYLWLEQDKIIYTLSGRGSFVAESKPQAVTAKIMSDFNDAVTAALKAGVTSAELRVRVDELASAMKDNKEGDEQDA